MNTPVKQPQKPHRTTLVRFESPQTKMAIAEYQLGDDSLVINAYRLSRADLQILRSALDEFETQTPAQEVTAP